MEFNDSRMNVMKAVDLPTPADPWQYPEAGNLSNHSQLWSILRLGKSLTCNVTNFNIFKPCMKHQWQKKVTNFVSTLYV